MAQAAGLPDDLSLQFQQSERRRKLAEMLQQDALNPIPNAMAGQYVVRHSPFQYLGKALSAYTAGAQQRGIDAEQGALIKQAGERRRNAAGTLADSLLGRPAQQPVTPNDDEGNPSPTVPAMPGALGNVPPQVQESLRSMLTADDPGLQAQGMSMAQQFMTQAAKANEPFSLREGEKRFGIGGTVIADNPKSQLTMAPNGQVVDLRNAPAGANYAKPETPHTEEISIGGGKFQRFQFNPQTRAFDLPLGQPYTEKPGTPRVNVNTSVNTEKTLLGNIAETVAKDVGAGPERARAAVGTINSIDSIRSAINSGKVITGPGADARVMVGQIGQVLGIGGKDATEQLANTRVVIKELAQQELNAAAQMKGQGAITENERKLIQKAASGNITFTGPELIALTGALEKTARNTIRQNQKNVNLLGANKNAASVVPFMNVEEPAARGAPPPPPGFTIQQ